MQVVALRSAPAGIPESHTLFSSVAHHHGYYRGSDAGCSEGPCLRAAQPSAVSRGLQCNSLMGSILHVWGNCCLVMWAAAAAVKCDDNRRPHPPPPAGDWTADSHLGTINQDIISYN